MVQIGKSNKQSRLIVVYVGGGGKTVPSMGGAEKQEIQLDGTLFLRKVERSDGKNLALELTGCGFEF